MHAKVLRFNEDLVGIVDAHHFLTEDDFSYVLEVF